MASVPGIPGSFVQILKDIYFETMFNAHLVLHQKRFEAALAAGRVPDHLVLSIFYHDSNGRATLKEDGFMIDWATRAGKLVFAAAEELQEYNMVTHSILTIFWASQGQWRRAVLHKLAAFAQIHVIGLHPKCSSQEQQWQAELRRRRFWACYCMDCHSSLDLHLTHSLSDPSSVPLPWPESNFNAEKMPSSNVMLHYDPSQPCGIYAAAMQALNLWYFSSEDVIVINGLTTVSLNARVTSLSAVRPCPSNTDRMTNATLYEIDGQLSRWWTVNPYNLTRNSIAAWPDHELSKVLMINFVYHQSFVAIHATRVPLFCGIRLGSDDVTSSSARLVSAQVALNHATSICDLAWLIMSSKKKMIRSLPNMVAYALYCGCIIQLPFLHCTDAGVQADAHARVEATLGLLEELGAFWRGPTIMSELIEDTEEVHLYRQAGASGKRRVHKQRTETSL
ncbi:hypothetical protein M409DRAFT_57795 [Zasmidium cellare ATCC 36951]|uniref:Xylanolytic transcriptional activator regulatory domain-containing protein n=1 Tax=Zasmidium cellare ATCC 36951 TaxID=1080233 RepID=A0A6A6CA66_ZASCE|nr:uncharacterized protein M409DRAFT_57795 [Zasmidium cellare ATCC 36951]KAF2163128.1 hypothetical protein M409DRAFT_57795 [Zasmidium cellare ATCC 36951]